MKSFLNIFCKTRISESPEPLDIIWENMTKNDSQKANVRRFSFFLTIVLLCSCTYLIYLLTLYSEESSSTSKVVNPPPKLSEFEKFIQDQY